MTIMCYWASEGEEDAMYAENYAPGSGSAQHGVILANWNDARLARWSELMDRLPHDERVEMDWSDSTSICGGCNLAIQTEPDSYSWEPQFIVTDGDIICRGCVESNIKDSISACQDDYLPPWAQEAAQGWVLYASEGASYPMNPEKYAEELAYQRAQAKRRK
jgi:hypothetical protein